uniref:Rap-GAP domain-containing protein n=1 Tax=Steinernema glaseri TaxID=37863 RepID=A0A1I7Z1J6_9BILA
MASNRRIPSRTTEEAQRGKRMFSSLQSALGGPNVRPSRGNVKKVESTSSHRLSCDDLMKELAKLNSDSSDVSFSDLSTFLKESVPHLSEEEVQEVAALLCESALLNGNHHIVADLIVATIHIASLREYIAMQIEEVVPKFFFDPDTKYSNLPEFFGQLLVARYPRPHNRSTDASNPILFTVISAVKGWIATLSSEEEEDEMKERCAFGVVGLCRSPKRRLWLCWPELVDEIYAGIEEVLIGSTQMSKEAKKELLRLFTQINSWPNSR